MKTLLKLHHEDGSFKDQILMDDDLMAELKLGIGHTLAINDWDEPGEVSYKVRSIELGAEYSEAGKVNEVCLYPTDEEPQHTLH